MEQFQISFSYAHRDI